MTDTALQQQLQRVQFLLVLAVSLLSGLVLGRDYADEAFIAVVSFVALSLVLLVSVLFSPPTE
ncbi:hypothetical protein [Haloarcula litorea]|uniref:hypothetical protein n=1 Tax=Haloarcula litorea TaxID=3032579 RepID=UPI0023E884DA|nr:hypothetical protein [Halomicroarcula sp. GDY20]